MYPNFVLKLSSLCLLLCFFDLQKQEMSLKHTLHRKSGSCKRDIVFLANCRRNINDDQRTYLIGKRYKGEKKEIIVIGTPKPLKVKCPKSKDMITMYNYTSIPEIINPSYVSLDEFNALKSAYEDTLALLANACKRITQLENAFFKHDSEGEILLDLDNQPALNIITTTEKPTEEKVPVIPTIPTTSLEIKASAIVEHMKEKVKPRNDAVFMNSNEIINFMKCELPENMRLKEDARNPRQAKKDLIEKAIKLFSDSVQIIRNKSGNKVTGIALKPSVKRTDTYGC
jgi:hypothetical protein